MTNADKPINPVEVPGYGEGNIQGMQTGNYSVLETGLTKREHFAVLAMQGWIACQHEGFSGSPENIAQRAVECADALLKQLEIN